MRAGLIVVVSIVAWSHPAVQVVIDSGGAVYYSDTTQVWRIAPDGSKSVAVPRVHAHELWVDERDNLFGEHLEYHERSGGGSPWWSHRIWRRSPEGQVVEFLPVRRGFLQDYRDFSFQRDRHGAMYWSITHSAATQLILRKARSGAPVETLARLPVRQVGWTSALPNGGVAVADHGSLIVVAPDGAIRRIGPVTKKRERHSVMGVWADGAGNLYAADTSGRAVKKISPAGAVLPVVTSEAPWAPTGGAVAADGALWILEAAPSNAQRIVRVAATGERTVF